ncbi:MAG: ribosome maturation factor RimP, partial [Alphaproteobacteria bacterium]|nr:ribosome maturation factor RimP [Alphaproteobacteria bacterium]
MDIITKIEAHLEKPYALEGYEIVRIQLNGMKRKTLQIMIDRLDGQAITLDDCTNVSHLTSMLLDQIDLIDDQYALEVSSTGLDRPLTKPHHFQKCVG